MKIPEKINIAKFAYESRLPYTANLIGGTINSILDYIREREEKEEPSRIHGSSFHVFGEKLAEQKESDWEKEFDRRFKRYVNTNDFGESSAEMDLKSFISQLLSKTREEEEAKFKKRLNSGRRMYQIGRDDGAAEASMVCNEKTIPQAVEAERARIMEIVEGMRKKHKVFECNGTGKYESWCEDENCPSDEAKAIKNFNGALQEILNQINQ